MTTLDGTDKLTERDRELLTEVKKVVQSRLPGANVLLYGSVARGDRQEDSDYDVLVVTTGPLASVIEDEVDDSIYDLQLQHGVLIVATYRAQTDWDANPQMPFYQQIEQDAIRL